MDILFHAIDDAVVILRSKGVYKQVKAYTRKGYVYAKHGSGFVRLTKRGTGLPNVNVDDFDLGFEPQYTKLGYMVEPGHGDADKRWK